MFLNKILTAANQTMLFKKISTCSTKCSFSTNKTVFLFGGQGNQ